MSAETLTFESLPVVGSRVSFRLTGPTWNVRCEGLYQGVRPSEWDGEPVHFFTDGVIGETPQGCFAIPVGEQVDEYTERREVASLYGQLGDGSAVLAVGGIGGAAGRLERFVKSGGDTDVLLEGL